MEKADIYSMLIQNAVIKDVTDDSFPAVIAQFFGVELTWNALPGHVLTLIKTISAAPYLVAYYTSIAITLIAIIWSIKKCISSRCGRRRCVDGKNQSAGKNVNDVIYDAYTKQVVVGGGDDDDAISDVLLEHRLVYQFVVASSNNGRVQRCIYIADHRDMARIHWAVRIYPADSTPPTVIYDKAYRSGLHYSNKSPIVDVMGNIYYSYGSFVCESHPLIESSTFDGTAKDVVAHASEAPTHKVWNYDSLQFQCALVELDPSLAQDMTHGVHNDIVETFRKRNQAMIGYLNEITSGTALSSDDRINMLQNVIRYAFDEQDVALLKNQLNPAERNGFGIIKKFVSAMSKFVSTEPKGDSGAGDGDVVLEMKALAEGTKIEWAGSIDYESLRKVAKVGDMIAVHGRATASNIICTLQSKMRGGSKFISHVLVVVDTTVFWMPGMVDGELYCIESAAGGGVLGDNIDSTPDIFGCARSGVQVRSLRSLLVDNAAHHHALYMWCPLNAAARSIMNQGVGIHRLDQHSPCRLVSNMKQYLNRRYTLTPANFLLGSRRDLVGVGGSNMMQKAFKSSLTSYAMHNQTPLGYEYFCSELVATVYCHVGLYKSLLNLETHQGRTLSELLPQDVLSQVLCVPRQVYPIDFFHETPSTPYLFEPIWVIGGVNAAEKQ